MSVFTDPNFDAHEQIVFFSDEETGLQAIVGIHNTKLGPAAGGCRMYPYKSVEAAISDVLRLSKGMSYKAALAGLPLGGGKSVIIGDPHTQKNEALIRAFARKIQTLNGQYYTALDIGIDVEDVLIMKEESEFTFGFPTYGTPVEFTSLGVFMGLKAAIKHQLGRDDLEGLSFSIQGVGNVGGILCRMIHEEGGHLFISDVDQDALDEMSDLYQAKQVGLNAIYKQEVAAFAPCAIGGIINDKTIDQLNTTIVAGGANNQLLRPEHGLTLHQKGILYAPDYLINSGGLIAASDDIFKINDRENVERRVRALYGKHIELFEESVQLNKPTSVLADEKTRILLGLTKVVTN